MNNKHTNIDNIFDKARKLEPVLNDNEVRELISTSTLIPVSKGIFNYGVNKMTILSSMTALVVSGLVLFNIIDSDIQEPTNNKATVEISTAKSNPGVKEKLPNDDDKDINKSRVNPNDLAMKTYNIDDNVDLPKESDKINGINTITLPYKDLELYNIKFDPKTNNYEVNSGKMRVTINQKLKTQFISNSEATDSDNKIVPKLITSANGNVKIAFLTASGDNENPEWSDNKPNQVIYTETIDDFSALDLDILKQMSPASIDSFLSHLGDTDNLGKFKMDKNRLSVHMNKFKDASDSDLSNIENFEFEFDFNDFDFSNFDSSLNKIMIFQNDSLLLNSNNIRIDLNNLDSLINKKIEQKIKILRKKSDSKIDSLDGSKLDRIRRMQLTIPESTRTKHPTKIDDKFIHLDNRLKMLSEMTVNKLIPVQFDIPSGGADIIFWFEPNQELLELVPDNIKSQVEAEIAAINSNEDICKAAPETGSETIMDIWRSCSGAVENMMVYPNPTNGPVSVNFQLKEDRKVKLSIHDLTGKLLMTLSPETLIRKGDFRENFNLAKLTPGMYLLVAQTHYGEQTLQRIVIE
jgi:hypothetical protein